jgi:hypothetical protein
VRACEIAKTKIAKMVKIAWIESRTKLRVAGICSPILQADSGTDGNVVRGELGILCASMGETQTSFSPGDQAVAFSQSNQGVL